jgi:transcriptional regulator with XRE-family HTH domain
MLDEPRFSRKAIEKFVETPIKVLAERSEVPLSTFSRWINGKQSPSFDLLEAIAPKHELTLPELVRGLQLIRAKKQADRSSDNRHVTRRRNQDAA